MISMPSKIRRATPHRRRGTIGVRHSSRRVKAKAGEPMDYKSAERVKQLYGGCGSDRTVK
jgi:hypothetical protein